ncbi:N-ethylammeline chlorohydrolase [Sulfolobales archaeon HS-7]|nr:N-ethylammeline chlorohydrolase [Sulfolobales archaeon HS-7]
MKAVLKPDLLMGTTDGVRREQNVLIEGNKITSIAADKSEENDAELIMGGQNRILMPGITAVGTPSLFPFRYRLNNNLISVSDILSTITPTDAHYFALLASYYFAKQGITTIIIDDPFPEQSARAALTVGIRPIPLVSAGCYKREGDLLKEYNLISQKWSSTEGKVMIKVCDPEYFEEANEMSERVFVSYKDPPESEKIILMGDGIKGLQHPKGNLFINTNIDPLGEWITNVKFGISIGVNSKFNVNSEALDLITRVHLEAKKVFLGLTKWPHEIIGIKAGVISAGYLADLILLNVDEPPGYPIDPLSPFDSVLDSIDKHIETVFVSGDPVIDGGTVLNVGEKDFTRAVEKFNEVLEKN